MQTTQELRFKAANSSRAANHLLAEKGSQRWSAADQATFDSHLAEAQSARDLLDAMQLADGNRNAVSAMYREGLEIYLRKQAKTWTASEAGKVRNAMSTTTPSEGGYAVPSIVAADMVDLLKGYGYMRMVAKEIATTSGADMSYPTSDGTAESGEILDQNAQATDLDMIFSTVPVNCAWFSSKVFAVPVQLLQDSAVDIVSMVMERARDRIGRIQNLKFTIGTGTGEPTGLVPAASVGKTGMTGQTLTIVYDDLADVVESVDEGFLGMPSKTPDPNAPPAGWMFSQTMRKEIRKIKDSNGRPVWMPSHDDGVSEVSRARLLDYPVYINNDMPVPAANAKSLAFGNLNSYVVRDALELVLRRFDDSAFALKGQVGFLGIARAGGNLRDSRAVKLYQHSAT